jgi:hypothetical protein
MEPALRDLGKVMHERYHLAARIARSYWPDETPADVLAAAVHTLFIELNRQLGHAAIPTSAPGSPVVTRPAGEAPPPCPKCRGPMVATGKKTPRMPDYRCADRACDTPLWLNKRNGAHP